MRIGEGGDHEELGGESMVDMLDSRVERPGGRRGEEDGSVGCVWTREIYDGSRRTGDSGRERTATEQLADEVGNDVVSLCVVCG